MERNLRATNKGCFGGCGKMHIESGEGFRIYVNGLGKRVFCEKCANIYETLGGYHSNARNNRGANPIGTKKKGALQSTTIGCEFEVYEGDMRREDFSKLCHILRRLFVTQGEQDCTVSAEYPTEAMQGLATVSAVLRSIEEHGLLDGLNNEHCGAHIHVSCNKVEYIRRYYHSIFLPLASCIRGLSTEKRIEYFGSDFRFYAHDINSNTTPIDHANIFNTQHIKTLEFRLPRVRTAKQYITVCKFWREIGYTINIFDLHEDAGDNATRLRYAKVLGEKLADIFHKYYEE